MPAAIDAEALRRDPALLAPTRGQVHLAWRWISRVYWSAPDIQFFAGVYAAAEWTLDLTDVAPVAPKVPGYEPPLVPRTEFGKAGDELDLIVAIRKGEWSVQSGGDYVFGASAWLTWWVGATEEPNWLPSQHQEQKSA